MNPSTQLNLPESHLKLLHIVSAIAWADGDLSEEEINLLIDQFNADLPIDPHPLFYAEDSTSLFGAFREYPPISEQLNERIDAELAFKEILINYQYNPIPLTELVAKLVTQEDRCLAVKLGYMVIKASPDPENQDKLISEQEKKVYRQLTELVDLEPNLISKIESQADRELNKFQHPFSAFIANIKYFLNLE